MNQHTPGPWEAEQITRTGRFGIWRVGVRLATTERRSDEHAQEEQANARLIAKAPEMKEELTGILRLFDRDDMPSLRDIRAYGEGVRLFMTYKQAERIRTLLREIEGTHDRL